jgi:arginyl-tRNA synthetase
VKGQEQETAEQRLLLFKSARIVLQKGLNILGLMALDKM